MAWQGRSGIPAAESAPSLTRMLRRPSIPPLLSWGGLTSGALAPASGVRRVRLATADDSTPHDRCVGGRTACLPPRSRPAKCRETPG
eukprot:scaffold1311_cov256-Pinguiococcus_pyrenoidosus.AAC.24